ncbi:sigma-70 family RNA polymerase sigma factor [Streptomyces phaeochromogenes]|nr:sigma-70 family RNA polymerase sigma factor [Streptomyces phaeochromogenes]
MYRDRRAEMTGLARRLLAEEGVPESVLGAEDVVQSAFAKALRTPANIREPRAYLYAVIRNDIRAAGRENRARRELAPARSGLEQMVGDVDVADFSELIANRMAVCKALYGLPPQQRTAVWATKAMDYTQAETAELMNKRPGTIATHVLRAVAALRAELVVILAVVGTVLLLAGERFLEVEPASGTEKAQAPHASSADWCIHLAAALLLITPFAVWAVRTLRKRWREFDEAGTFPWQSVANRIRQGLTRWWRNKTATWEIVRNVWAISCESCWM